MQTASDIQPHDPDPLAESFRKLLDLIAAECERAGYLPRNWR
jgi:hypothetical protein